VKVTEPVVPPAPIPPDPADPRSGAGSQHPQDRLGQLTDLATPYAIRAVATLRIADLIASGVQELDALADAADVRPGPLGRLLRYLVHRDLFAEATPEVFTLTDVGRLLCETGAAGQRQWLDLGGLGFQMDLAYTGLLHSLRTGGAGFPAVHGRTLWEHLDEQSDQRRYFDELMLAQQLLTAPQVAQLYDWSGVRHVFDIGGGSGELLAELLRTHPHLRGTLVDRTGPVRSSADRLATSGVSARADFVAADFFGALPAGGDVYVVSRAITDWNDQDAATILRRCGDAAGPRGRVLIVEVMPTQPHVPHLAPFDLQMLVTVGGQERGLDDFQALAWAAGLRVTGVTRGRDGLTLIECACVSS
jgi:SAM-dependent methyltransferase